MERTNITSPKEFKEKLRQEARKKNMTVSEYIRHVMTILWESEGK